MPDFERFRILLEEERARKMALLPALRADIASANSARQDSNVDDEHDPEGATIAFELSQASALLQQSSAGLDQVEAALARIADGTFGTCAVCGEAIAEGRLEARPWTPFCIGHASMGRIR
jgi:DnaK suppressor protein